MSQIFSTILAVKVIGIEIFKRLLRKIQVTAFKKCIITGWKNENKMSKKYSFAQKKQFTGSRLPEPHPYSLRFFL